MVLLVGGAGYIGSHVSYAFLEAGHAVLVYDNLRTSSQGNIDPRAQFVYGSLLDTGALSRVFASYDIEAVVYLAALKAVGDSMSQVPLYSENNLIGAVNLMNAMAQAGVKTIIFSSSAAVYGEADGLIDEQSPLKPCNFYGFGKKFVEDLFAWHDSQLGLRFAALRYFNAAGYDPAGKVHGLETQPGNLIPRAVEALLGYAPQLQIFGTDYPTSDGTAERDYVHVSDLAQAHLRSYEILTTGAPSFSVNLGTENLSSVRQVVAMIEKVSGKSLPAVDSPRRAGDPAILGAKTGKAKELLGWNPQRSSLQTIIASTLAQYDRERS